MRVLAAKWRTREILCSQKTPVLAVACVFLMEFSCGPQTVSRQFTAVASVSAPLFLDNACACSGVRFFDGSAVWFQPQLFHLAFTKRLCMQWRAFSLIPEKSILGCFKTERFFHLQNACACSGVRFPKYLKTQFCNSFISFKKTPVLAVACVFPNTWKHNFVLFQTTTSGCITKSCQKRQSFET